MIGRLNHIAIAVPDLAKAAELYRDGDGRQGERAQGAAGPWRHGGVRRAAQHQDRAAASPGREVADRQLPARNADGGIHHVCYEVEDIYAARDKLKAQGARVLGDGEPKIGAHDKPVLFLHPKDFTGTLIELEQVWSTAMSWATGLMVYLVIWWTILFAVLPLGVRRLENPGRGRGAGRSGAAPAAAQGDHHLDRRRRAVARLLFPAPGGRFQLPPDGRIVLMQSLKIAV